MLAAAAAAVSAAAMALSGLGPLAIVTQDQTALRAAPNASATTQAQLTQGDLLEVRGERIDHLQVYDHQRERAGYVRAVQVKPLVLTEDNAPQLLTVLRFLRDTPGSEPLGIAYVAAYLKAAPAAAITAEPFDALGTMAERLARRASVRNAGANVGANVGAHLEAAGRYGVKFTSFERDGAVQLCYEGDAFRRVLAMPAALATADQQARAALALTRGDCVDPALPPSQKPALDRWRAETLDRVTPAQAAQLDAWTRNRLRVRAAAVWSAVAYARAREGSAAADAAQRAIDALAAVNKTELTDDDSADLAEAAVRVGASRWAAEPQLANATARLTIGTQAGAPGQTCVNLASPAQTQPLMQRCTYGVVWPASARPAPDGRSLVLAVQTLESWTELWVFRASAAGWQIDVLPPAASDPVLGYTEFAGWVPAAAGGGGQKLLLAREARTGTGSEARLRRSFEVMALDTLVVDKQAGTPKSLVLFQKWQDAAWKQQTLSLR